MIYYLKFKELRFKEISQTYGEIWCRLFITTKEYVDKVKGSILNQISISYYPATSKLEEISFTIYDAIDGAQIIRMSQNGIQPDKFLLVQTIGSLSKKLTAINMRSTLLIPSYLKLEINEILSAPFWVLYHQAKFTHVIVR